MGEFFNYFFYRCYCYYLKTNEDGGTPTFWSSSILSIAIGLNILFVVYFLGYSTSGGSFHPDKYNVVLGVGVIWFIVFVRYKYFITFFSLNEKWQKEPKTESIRRGKIVVAYLVGSFVLTIGGAILLNHLVK